jgi:ABC-type Fe3+ transport system substrate-binding protein
MKLSRMMNQRNTIIYASLGLRKGIPELLWAFRKSNILEEFPVYLDDHPFPIFQRIRQESGFGMKTADVVLLPHYMALRMKSEGMLHSYSPKGIESYPTKFRDPGRKWFALGITYMSLAYNTESVSPWDLPKTIEELSSDKWKDRLGMQSLVSSSVGNLGAQYIASIRRQVGDKRWMTFLNRISSLNVKTFDCIDHLVQGLLDKRIDIALTTYSLAYFRERIVNSPVKSFEIQDIPRMLTFTSAALTKWGENNSSARTFLDFLASNEAQRIVGTIPGISPSKPGIRTDYDFEVNYTAKSKFHPDRTDILELPKLLEVFKNLGLP